MDIKKRYIITGSYLRRLKIERKKEGTVKATEAMVQEFSQLHQKYMEADKRMLILQGVALEGMRKIGVGCTPKESKEEFKTLKGEIERVLARMKEICESID